MKLVVRLCLLIICYTQLVVLAQNVKLDHQDNPLRKIAFGSCNRDDGNQSIWQSIVQYKPDIWVWLGDAVYADTKVAPFFWVSSTPDAMRQKYANQKTNHFYAQLRQQTKIIGVWDDHDYGKNDGGAEYADREVSKQIYLDFVDEPADSPRRTQEGGIYASYILGPPGKRVHIILLDVRYNKQGVLGEGDILGEVQWKWLEDTLAKSDAQIHLIGSGIQILPRKIGHEKWLVYPESRRRLFELIKKTKTSGAILLSGDVHYGELMRLNSSCSGLGYPVYEITSSGLTHTCEDNLGTFCKAALDYVMTTPYHIGEFFTGLNFGSIEIDWDAKPSAKITLQLRNLTGDVVVSQQISLGELKFHETPEQVLICEQNERPFIILLIPFEWWKYLVYFLTLGLIFTVVYVIVKAVPKARGKNAVSKQKKA